MMSEQSAVDSRQSVVSSQESAIGGCNLFLFLIKLYPIEKTLTSFLLLTCLLLIANCQLKYWQQEVNYTIDVSLNDKDHTLNGFEKIEYINNSPDTLKFHLVSYLAQCVQK